ncbi:hypothetical protein MFIFM68171_04686 [Madurella fahalii]|uniref:Microbial-type PARG catalytic domain-containing protein n=1 Tax=Madurella fahalii TaxID=1157608 RepID=A0ABQ0G9N1_9PEZI
MQQFVRYFAGYDQGENPPPTSSTRPRIPPRKPLTRRTLPHTTRKVMSRPGSGSGLGFGGGQGSDPSFSPRSPRGSANSSPSSRESLRVTARETQDIVESVLDQLGMTERAQQSDPYSLDTLGRLNPYFCPSFSTPTRIQVLNEDTLNAALNLAQESEKQDAKYDNPHPVVVNFARHDKPGGGWLNGALAQEESLCYRSSLWKTLHYTAQNPLQRGEAIYSPYVIVVRNDLKSGHSLLPGIQPLTAPPPIMSAISIAAIRNPRTQTFRLADGTHKTVFRTDFDRDFTKQNMRLVLRIAAHKRHRHLVLGALGCGVYANPPEDVAHCWLEVLREDEFSGGWWRQIHFAVFDPRGDGNYDIFKKVLHGQTV